VPDLSVAVPTVVSDRLHTRLQSGMSKPKKFTNGTVRYAYFCSTGEPSTTAEAFADSRWKAAMDEKYDALIKNNTWHLVPSTHGQHVIDCKWVYKIKRKADGTVDRNKARLVAKGFNNSMGLTMKRLLVLLSKLLLFVLFYPLLFLVVGIFDS
jgi:histone deacetylase 1/2